jgi:hypothetical protein
LAGRPIVIEKPTDGHPSANITKLDFAGGGGVKPHLPLDLSIDEALIVLIHLCDAVGAEDASRLGHG